jgi:hypothetical protein
MKINFHELNVYNKPFAYIGAILLSTGVYLDDTNKVDKIYVWILLLSALFFLLMAFRKPKNLKED